jgi:hypothetical protein
MTETTVIPVELLTGCRTLAAGATAYPPLPIDPFENLAVPSMAGPRPAPRPTQPPSPGGPAYPSLPTETDTREGSGGESR